MTDIQVHCGSCGNVFPASEDMAGLIATCPRCERQISVPLPEGFRGSRPKLQIKREGTLSGGKRCPACDSSMAAEAVICLQCGYDTRTGRSLAQTSAGLPMAKPLLALLGVVILGGLLWTLLRPRADTTIMGDPAPPATGIKPPPRPEEPAAKDDPATMLSATSATSEEPAGIVSDEAQRQPEEPSREEIRLRMAAMLDARYPMHTPGSAVVLRRVNGLIHRGQLLSLEPDFVVLRTEEGDIRIPFESLDMQSRMHCDAGFREKYIRHRSAQAAPFVETL